MDARSPHDSDNIFYSPSPDSNNDLVLDSNSSDSDEARPDLNDNIEMKYTVKSKLTRQPSFVVIKDNNNAELTFTAESRIGSGNQATLLRFSEIDPPQDTQALTFAVRKPHTHLTYHKTFEEHSAFLEKERRGFEFRKAVYPNEAPYQFFSSLEVKSAADTNRPFHTSIRVVFPEIKNADTFEVFLQKNRDYDLLALVIYNMTVELQRIHEVIRGFHGDISSGNILIDRNDFSIHFIDFIFGYYKDEDATVGYCSTLKEVADCYFAPERKTLTDKEKKRLKLEHEVLPPCPADASQDVYSLASMLENAMFRLHKQPDKSLFMNAYPCIIDFMALGKEEPSKRPTLTSFIDALAPLLFKANLKHNLINLNTHALIPLLDKLIAEYNELDIYHVFYSLCRNEEYLCIKPFADYLCLRKPNDKMNSVLSLFTYLARCGKRTANIANRFFCTNDRLSLIKETNLAFELADLIIHGHVTPCSVTSYEEIQKLPTLQSIFEDLVNDGYLTKPANADKLNLVDTNEKQRCLTQ